MFDGLIDVLIEWLVSLYNSIVTAVDAILLPIADALPDLSAEISFIYTWGGFANEWISLDFGFTLLAAWFVCVALIIGIKWILGLIPTIN